MQTFEEILQQEMAQPVRIKGSDATVTPQQAMIKSVMANAMKGDLSAILFLKQMTRPAETDGDRQHQTAQRISGLEKPNMFVYGGGDDVAEWCKQHDVVHVKEYMNRGRE